MIMADTRVVEQRNSDLADYSSTHVHALFASFSCNTTELAEVSWFLLFANLDTISFYYKLKRDLYGIRNVRKFQIGERQLKSKMGDQTKHKQTYIHLLGKDEVNAAITYKYNTKNKWFKIN